MRPLSAPSTWPRATVCPAVSSSSSSKTEYALEKLLELHGVAHVALDAQLPGHEGGRGVLLAVDDPQERVLGRGDRCVGLAVAFADARPAVLDADDPLAGPVDIEQVGGIEAGGLRRARSASLEGLKELAHVLGRHGATLPILDGRDATSAPSPPGISPRRTCRRGLLNGVASDASA